MRRGLGYDILLLPRARERGTVERGGSEERERETLSISVFHWGGFCFDMFFNLRAGTETAERAQLWPHANHRQKWLLSPTCISDHFQVSSHHPHHLHLPFPFLISISKHL